MVSEAKFPNGAGGTTAGLGCVFKFLQKFLVCNEVTEARSASNQVLQSDLSGGNAI